MEARIKIQKWGNDLGINIPTMIANISYNLTDMLSEITENNIHRCIETGTPTGNEIW